MRFGELAMPGLCHLGTAKIKALSIAKQLTWAFLQWWAAVLLQQQKHLPTEILRRTNCTNCTSNILSHGFRYLYIAVGIILKKTMSSVLSFCECQGSRCSQGTQDCSENIRVPLPASSGVPSEEAVLQRSSTGHQALHGALCSTFTFAFKCTRQNLQPDCHAGEEAACTKQRNVEMASTMASTNKECTQKMT